MPRFYHDLPISSNSLTITRGRLLNTIDRDQFQAQVRAHTSISLAAGERYHNKWEFRELIVNGYVNHLRPDACHCGGITEMRKIAAMGETYYQSLILHNSAGPLGTAASLHAALAIPNVTLLFVLFGFTKAVTVVLHIETLNMPD